MGKMTSNGVLYVTSHIIIFVVILGCYMYTLATGHPDNDLKGYVGMMLAYWFGAVGMDKIKGKDNNNG